VIIIAAIAGIALIALGIYYFVEPAHSLPSWLPGHEAGSNHHHIKHGIASFLLGVALLVFAWFQSAPERSRSTAV
jgi:ammonia channel protein AmtB